MRRMAVPFFLGLLFLIVQTTWLAFPLVQKVRPDLLLILTLFLGLSFPPITGGILAFFLGYLMDLFTGNGYGLYALSRLLLFYTAQLFKDRLYLEGFSSRSLLVFFLALGEGIFILVLLKALNPNPLRSPYLLFFTVFLPQSFSTALLSSPVISFLRKGMTLLDPQPRADIGGRR